MFDRASAYHRMPKLPVVVALVAAVGVGAGLGAAASLRTESATPTIKPGVIVSDVGEVSAFRGAPSAAERSIAAHANVRHDMESITADTGSVPDEFLPGDRVGPVRVPLANLGDASRAIWMYRTTCGKVCYGLTDFTAGCVQQLPVSQVLNPTGGDPGDGGGTIVWGFARNNVRSVDVIVKGQPQPAAFGRNVFFFQAPSTAAGISAVVATTADGSKVMLPIALKQPSTVG